MCRSGLGELIVRFTLEGESWRGNNFLAPLVCLKISLNDSQGGSNLSLFTSSDILRATHTNVFRQSLQGLPLYYSSQRSQPPRTSHISAPIATPTPTALTVEA